MTELIRSFSWVKLKIEVYGIESGAGEASAEHVTNLLKSTLAEKGKANLILATGTSQLHSWRH